MIEVQCTSCHTRYRIDEQVLPEGTPTFKCSRCGHVFTFEPREAGPAETPETDEHAARVQRDDEPESPVQPPPKAKPPEAAPAEAPARERQPADSESPAQPSASPASSGATSEAAAEQPQSAVDQARRTEQFFSSLFAEKKKDAADTGDNLAFDFRDEEPSPDQTRSKPKRRKPEADREDDARKWEVGDDSTFDDPAGEAASARDIFRVEDEPPRKRRKPRAPEPADEDDEFIDEDEAPIYNRGLAHSARFFVMMFLIVGLGFGAMTLLIHNAPAAAAELLSRFPVIGGRFEPPTTPARLVALRGISAAYQRGKDGHTALLVMGDAENVAAEPLHVVQIAASLRDVSQRPLASQAVYCGNNLSAKMAGQMTPHEIEFFQKLDPPKSFVLEPSAACRFVIAFIDPPAGVSSFAMSVEQAVPAPAETAAAPPF